jgi:hypothetical protein
MQVYQETKSAIIDIMTELTITPTLEFEKLVCEKDTVFRPTRENMTALKVCNFTVYLIYGVHNLGTKKVFFLCYILIVIYRMVA